MNNHWLEQEVEGLLHQSWDNVLNIFYQTIVGEGAKSSSPPPPPIFHCSRERQEMEQEDPPGASAQFYTAFASAKFSSTCSLRIVNAVLIDGVG